MNDESIAIPSIDCKEENQMGDAYAILTSNVLQNAAAISWSLEGHIHIFY